MAEVTVTERTRQQGARLAKLRQHGGLTKPQLADRLGFGSTQTYDLYERGTSVIRLDRIEDWAGAFGLSEEAFFAVLIGKMPAEDAYWSIRTALHGLIPEDHIDELAREHEGKSVADQRAAIEGILDIAAERREANGPLRERNRPA